MFFVALWLMFYHKLYIVRDSLVHIYISSHGVVLSIRETRNCVPILIILAVCVFFSNLPSDDEFWAFLRGSDSIGSQSCPAVKFVRIDPT